MEPRFESARRVGLSTCTAGCLLLLVFAIGCADVTVLKEREGAAGACMDGFRYYLPRPYLSVKKEMPVAGGEFVVTGRLDRSGVIVVQRDQIPAEVQDQFSKTPSEVYIPLSLIKFQGVGTPVPRAAEQGDEDPKSEASMSSVPLKAEDGYGTTGYEGDFIDIAYLPDFDEKYVIKFKSGLGVAGTGPGGVTLRHGWMLENFSVTVNNERLGQFIYESAAPFVDIAQRVAQQHLLPFNLRKDVHRSAEQGDGAEGEAAKFLLPKYLSLRLSYVLKAQPGVYPILKPDEIDQLRLGECPKICMPVTVKGRAISSGDWMYVPYPPFTVVAYTIKKDLSVMALSLPWGSEDGNGGGGAEPGDPELTKKVKAWMKRLGNLPKTVGGKAADVALSSAEVIPGGTLVLTYGKDDKFKAADKKKLEDALTAAVSGLDAKIKKVKVSAVVN